MSVSDNLLTLFQFMECNSDVEGVNSIAGTSRQQRVNRKPRDECKLEHNPHSNRERVNHVSKLVFDVEANVSEEEVVLRCSSSRSKFLIESSEFFFWWWN